MTAPSDGHMSGVRVRILLWHVDDKRDAARTDEYGYLRDAHNAVVGVNDNYIVPPGTEGTVTGRDDAGTWHVQWDNGCRLGMLTGLDQWELIV